MAGLERSTCEPCALPVRYENPLFVWERYALQKSFNQIARSVCVSKSTVRNIVRLFGVTGGFSPRERATPPVQKTLCPLEIDYIVSFVLVHPTRTLQEVVSGVSTVLGANISAMMVCRLLKESNITKRKPCG